MMKNKIIALERVGTGSQALSICCLNCQKNVMEPSSGLRLRLLESFQLSFFIIYNNYEYYNFKVIQQTARFPHTNPQITFTLLLNQMQQYDNNHPILAQLKILKNKLDQKGKIIKVLSKCIEIQQNTLFTIVSQFQQHESKIMRRLHRLQQINLRYIKDYLQIKKQNKVEDFIPIEHMFVTDAKQFIKHKIQNIQKIKAQNQQSSSQQAKKTIDNCINLMKNYLLQRKVNYDRMVSFLSDERKKKMKESKGLEGYRQNKEQAKFIETLKVKIQKFGKKIASIDNHNAVQLFHSRQEIQKDVNRLDPSKGQITLEESKIEQEMFKSIIQELISYNSIQQQEQYLIHGSFNYISDKFQTLCQTYGIEFIKSSIQGMNNLSHQAKNAIINTRLAQKNSLNKKQTNSSKKAQTMDNTNLSEEQQKQLKKLQKRSCNKDDQQEQDQQDTQYLYNRIIGKGSKNKQQKSNNKLNQRFEKTKTTIFFQQQQKSRDQLISIQKKQIAEHEKVIDKLINFIKKEFKDLNMDDIDADDPEQLIGYYFKVNQKKYVDIRQQMQELQKETAKAVSNLQFDNESLTLKIGSLKEQMDQLLQKYQKSSFEFHILISRTQDLVKISLQTLINTCMNNITPQQLIAQLEKIISLIKDNIDKKRNITYKLSVKEEYLQCNQPKVTKKDYISQNQQNNESFALGEILLSFIQKQRLQNNEQFLSAIIPTQQKKQQQKQPSVDLQKMHENQIKQGEQIIIPNKEIKLEQPQKKSQGFDQVFLKSIVRQLEIIKDRRIHKQSQQIQDIKEMYSKYKQALDCLERAEHLNRQNQIKYQQFLNGLKKKGAWGCPQKLEEKLFYMQKIIAEQEQLLQNQRTQYEQTVLKQVKQSQKLAASVLSRFRVQRRQTRN